MEQTESNSTLNNNKNSKLYNEIKPNILEWSENITEVNISQQNISGISESIKFPLNLQRLNISHNNLLNVPTNIMKLSKLKYLNLSDNKITYFDETPRFYCTIEHLNISNNKLMGPPYWVWVKSPKNLQFLNLSNNTNISDSFSTNEYYEELLQYSTDVKEIIMYNCKLQKYSELFGTFSKAVHLELGNNDSRTLANFIDYVPKPGLDKCCDIEIFNLSNCKIFSIKPNINIYKKIKEIDLSMNNISTLPNEFCYLESLEKVVLSNNNLLYLPENMDKIINLKYLYLDSNDLCMLPEKLYLLSNLVALDLYNNNVYEIHDHLWNLQEIDVAYNFMEEPTELVYLRKRQKLRYRRLSVDRVDGKKQETERSEDERSVSTSDDEEYQKSLKSDEEDTRTQLVPETTSSEEDWDSDEYWVPHGRFHHPLPDFESPWISFVKKKIVAGNFCPIDQHTVPVAEMVKYEWLCNPVERVEVPGQFDDLSDDDS